MLESQGGNPSGKVLIIKMPKNYLLQLHEPSFSVRPKGKSRGPKALQSHQNNYCYTLRRDCSMHRLSTSQTDLCIFSFYYHALTAVSRSNSMHKSVRLHLQSSEPIPSESELDWSGGEIFPLFQAAQVFFLAYPSLKNKNVKYLANKGVSSNIDFGLNVTAALLDLKNGLVSVIRK